MSKTSPDNKIWHSECLKCSECNKLLDSKYFETSGRLYCRNDYLTYFGPSCFGCATKITDDQYFFSIKQTTPATGRPSGAESDPLQGSQQQSTQQQPQQQGTPQTNNINTLFFHDKCFSCNYCSRHLQKGDKYCVIDNSTTPQTKTLMICHEICALKYYSANNNNNNNNNNVQSNNNALHGAQPIQQNAPTPRAKRGRAKQNRPA